MPLVDSIAMGPTFAQIVVIQLFSPATHSYPPEFATGTRRKHSVRVYKGEYGDYGCYWRRRRQSLWTVVHVAGGGKGVHVRLGIHGNSPLGNLLAPCAILAVQNDDDNNNDDGHYPHDECLPTLEDLLEVLGKRHVP